MSFAEKVKLAARRIKTETIALSLAFRHKRTPVFARILIFCTLCYALSPIDLIPDFIPVLGYLDDMLILPMLIFLAVRLIPSDVMIECRQKVIDEPQFNRRFGWFAATAIILVWILIVVFFLFAFGLL